MQVSSTLSSFPTRRVLIQPCWTPWGHYNNDNDGNQWWSSWATPMFTTSVWSSLNHYHHYQQCYYPDTDAKAVPWELSYFDPHIIIWWSSCHNMMVIMSIYADHHLTMCCQGGVLRRTQKSEQQFNSCSAIHTSGKYITIQDLVIWGFGDLRIWWFGDLVVWWFGDLRIWGSQELFQTGSPWAVALANLLYVQVLSGALIKSLLVTLLHCLIKFLLVTLFDQIPPFYPF